MTDFGTSTNFTESVNICLMALGERAVSAVSSLTGSGQNRVVHLCMRALDEVNKDVEARGWWFQVTRGQIIGISSGTPEWNASHPEEFRRYVTIRAARILQTRYITDETLHKLTLEEEMYSKAILEAKDAAQNGFVTFGLPSEIEDLGITGVMFLQSNLEEKLATLKLGTELAQADLVAAQKLKVDKETILIESQELLIDQQKLTEIQETAKRTAEKELLVAQELKVDQETAKTLAETSLIADQEALVTQQKLTEAQNTTKVQREAELLQAQELKTDAEITLIADQEDLVEQQVLTEAQNTTKVQREAELLQAQELKVDAETSLIADQEDLVEQQVLTEVQNTTKTQREAELLSTQAASVGADIELKEQQSRLTSAQELKTDAEKLLIDEQAAKTTAEAALIADQEALVTQQLQTEINETSKRLSEKGLIDAQTSSVSADIDLKQQQSNLTASQELKVDAETATEGSRKLDIEADTTLKGKQGALIDAQELKTDAETTLTTKQGALVDAQELKTDAEKLLVDAQTALTADQELKTVSETALLDSQKTKLDAETAYMVTAEKNWFDNGGVDISGTVRSYKDFRPEMRIMGIQEAAFQSLPAYKKVELIKDANQLRTDRVVVYTNSVILVSVNKVLRMLGVSKISSNTNEHALASEAKELLEDVDLELQSRGWWFNTEKDVTFTVAAGGQIIVDPTTQLYEELDDYDTARVYTSSGDFICLKNLADNTINQWSGTIKGTRIVKRSITTQEVPQKYREYLEVKVAAILAELYPQSGSEIQRIRKLEAELETYFKDRENDQGNYNIFDNYDTNERIGFNRNYDLN